MKRLSCLLLFGFGMILLAAPCQARPKRATPAPAAQSDNATSEPDALSPEAAPKIDPQAAPSLSLGPFVDAHLGKILAPLGERAFVQTEIVASLQAGYAAGLATTPANHQPAYQLALAVCRELGEAIAERQAAVSNLRGALATRSSESEQPRGGGEAVAKAKDSDAFFVNSQKSAWTTRAAALRQNVAALYLRERQAETQIGPWNAPAPMPPPAVAGASTPSVSAPAAAKGAVSGSDPVVGKWKWEGYIDVTLNANGTLGGRRHGTWQSVTAADGKRHYEVRYGKRPESVEQLTLSDDGRSLEGANQDGKYLSAQRR